MTESGELSELRAHQKQLEGECARRHERVTTSIAYVKESVKDHDRLLVELSGRSGKNGVVGEIRGTQETHAERIAKLEIYRWKSLGVLSVLMVIASLAGSSLGVYILQAMAGAQ